MAQPMVKQFVSGTFRCDYMKNTRHQRGWGFMHIVLGSTDDAVMKAIGLVLACCHMWEMEISKAKMFLKESKRLKWHFQIGEWVEPDKTSMEDGNILDQQIVQNSIWISF